MKFTTPCFIRKNTPELREKLEEMGRRKASELFSDRSNHLVCLISPTGAGYYDSFDNVDYFPADTYIDCDDHIELFLALAALREDSDYMQWFVFTQSIYDKWNAPEEIVEVYKEGQFVLCSHNKMRSCYVRKATPAELISHFTEKGGGE